MRFVVALFIVILSVFSVWFFFFKDNHQPTQGPQYTDLSYDTLSANNPAFVEGENFLKERKTDEAITSFEKALTLPYSKEEEAQIKYSMVLAYSSTSKSTDGYKKAIALTKEIVANLNYTPSVKALSLEAIERLLASSIAAEAATLIAEGQPYEKFYEEKTIYSLRKNLLSYAESFYPLAGVEMKLASLHAKDLSTLSQQNTENPTDKAKIEFEKKFILEAINRGDADLNGRMKAVPRLAVYTPEVLLYRALAADRFFQATKETPFGDIETLYKTAFETGEKYYRPQLPLIEYYYAVFLAHTGDTKRTPDIQALLRPYGTPEASKAYMAGMFRKERENILGEKKNLILLASLDPQFKSYLQSLGWSETDF